MRSLRSKGEASCLTRMEPRKTGRTRRYNRLDSAGVYMVTAATLHKEHLFKTAERRTSLERELLSLAKRYEWQLEAWAAFSNHYHFVGRESSGSGNLKKFLKHLHADTARELNQIDNEAHSVVQLLGYEADL